MEAWIWLVAYLIGFALLQLVLYRYFQQRESTHEGESSRNPGFQRLEQSSASATTSETTENGSVRCQHCGTPNEAETQYTYCRECAEPLR
jgi:hypothetical protein